MWVDVSPDDSATLAGVSLPVICSSQAFSRCHVSLIITVDYTRCPRATPSEVSSNDIIISTPASIGLVINHLRAPAPYRHPNSYSVSYFVCQMADHNIYFFAQWVLQADYIRPAFHSHLLHGNGPHVWPWTVVLDHSNQMVAGAPTSVSSPVPVMIVVAISVSLIMTSLASLVVASSSTSTISCSSHPQSAATPPLRIEPKTTLFVPIAMGIAFLVGVCPAGSILVLHCAAMVASLFFVHLLLNRIGFQLQLGYFSTIRPQSYSYCALHPTQFHLWSLVRWYPDQLQHLGLQLHLVSMWPHLQWCAHLLSRPAFVNTSTLYCTSAALMPFIMKLYTTLLPFMTKSTDDVAISPFCLLSLMLMGFASHRTWVEITMPSIST